MHKLCNLYTYKKKENERKLLEYQKTRQILQAYFGSIQLNFIYRMICAVDVVLYTYAT